MPELPLQPIRRLIEQGAGNLRISQDSVERARSIAEEMIVRSAKVAARIADDDDRKTIMERDFERAWVEYFMGKSIEKEEQGSGL